MDKKLLESFKEVLKMDLERETTHKGKLEVIKRHNTVGKLLCGAEWKDFKLEEIEKEMLGS